MDKVIHERGYRDNFEKQEIFYINYYDLDKIIQKEYDCPDFTCALGQNNDSVEEFDVDEKFNKYSEEKLKYFLETKDQEEYSTVRLLLNDLCRKQRIDPGKYLVRIAW